MKKTILLILTITTFVACVNLDSVRFTDFTIVANENENITDFKMTTTAYIADDDTKKLIEDVIFASSFEQPVLDQQTSFKLFWANSFYLQNQLEKIEFNFSVQSNGVEKTGTFSTLSFNDDFNAIYDNCYITLFLTEEDITENQYQVTMANMGNNPLRFNSGVTKVFNFLD